MQDRLTIWALPALFVVAGIAMLFVRVESGEPGRAARINPGFALFRFAIFRYAMAVILVAFGLFMHFALQ
ncbi:MAG TPA: hypothetical protein VFH52_06140 [Rhodanobacteraceae bacterium]|nr:hypothetical protein [Rhodanobacteraceae bacterium]